MTAITATGVRMARKLPWNVVAPVENGLACAHASVATNSAASPVPMIACLLFILPPRPMLAAVSASDGVQIGAAQISKPFT
jgi:hypothetical protein